MKQAQGTLGFDTGGQGLTEITADIARWVAEQGMDTGLLSVYCRHTSASLVIQENADPDVIRDLEAFFKRLVAEDPKLYNWPDSTVPERPESQGTLARAARCWSPAAKASAGIAAGTPSAIDSTPPFSLRLRSSHRSMTASAESSLSPSPNTCGWRPISLVAAP